MHDHDPCLQCAWEEAEEALPEGWYVGALSYHGETWLAQAYEPTEAMAFNSGFGPTPTAALQALAAKLREADR